MDWRSQPQLLCHSDWGRDTHTHARPFPASPLVNLRECLQLRVGAPRMSDPELLMSGPLGEETQLGTAEKEVLVPLSSGPGLR